MTTFQKTLAVLGTTMAIAAGAGLWFLPDLRRLSDPYYQTPGELVVRSKQAIVERLKDPESVRFGEVRAYSTFEGAGMIACGTFNAKNALGGYVGFKRFTSSDSAVSQPAIEDGGTQFDETWNRCTGKVLASAN